MVGTMLAKLTGASPFGAMVAGISGAILGAVVAWSMFDAGTLCLWVWVCVALIIIMIIGLILGGSDCKPIKITYTCQPWQAPTGGSDCDKCNGDPLKPCSEYRCNSLGGGCNLLNKGTDHELCVDSNPNDVTGPVITPDTGEVNGSGGNSYTDINGSGFRISGMNGGCVNAYTNLVLSLNTDEPSICRFDSEMNTYDNMSYDFGNYYSKKHTIATYLPDPSHGQSQGLNWSGKIKFYVKCKDAHGNEAPIGRFYVIDSCVNQGNDTTAPIINSISPATNSLLGFNTTTVNVTVNTRELAECKWSSSDKDYSLMENNFDCPVKNWSEGFTGGVCTSNLSITNATNKFYIRCKDQPWLDAANRSNERNANQESTLYVLNKVMSPLKIERIAPNSSFETSTAQTTFTLGVLTSGGGKYPLCSYSFSGYERMISFFETEFSNKHEQEFNLAAGNWKIYIECKDETGDSDRAEASFNIQYDSNSPGVARVFIVGNELKIITTENADCRYSKESCGYDFSSASSMGNAGNIHSTSISTGGIFYIKCKDGFGNIPDYGVCTVIAKPSELTI